MGERQPGIRSIVPLGLALCLSAATSAALADDGALTARILKHDRDLERRVVGLSRVRFSHPTQLSGTVGAMVARQPAEYDCTTVCEYRGWLFQAEPGLTGGQVSAGYAVVNGEKRRNRHFLSRIYLAYGLKGAVLRTWGSSNLDPSAQTLAGLEGDFTVIGVNFSLGLFRPLQSSDESWVVTGGVGWGF